MELDASATFSWHTRAKPLIENGLYDPAFEHDACGVGLVASVGVLNELCAGSTSSEGR